MSDTNNRGQAEAQLRDREERLRLIVEAAQVGIFDWQATESFVTWSGAYSQLLGLSPGQSQLTFDEFLNLLHAEDRAAVKETVMQSLLAGSEYVSEFRIALPNDAVRWMQQRGRSYLDDQGKPYRVLGILQDITDRKLLEQERERLLVREQQARAAAESAAQAREDFVATVSHELRAPLNALFGWARILKSGKYDEATLAHAIDVIERSVNIQKQLIDDLLDTARIINGKLRLEPHPVNLVRVLDAAVAAARPAIEAKGQSLELDIQSVDVVTGDASRLQQVLANLLGNAIKFTPRGGRITVRLERRDPQMRITVTDTGKGISAELLPQIFKRFEQSDQTSARRYGGLGLGLALVRQLVDLHGGTVEADSPGENQGATFTVNLPLRALRTPPLTPPKELPIGVTPAAEATMAHLLKGVCALVVDDESDARELLAALLKQYGAAVVATSSVSEALAALNTAAQANQLPDVLISDIGMPGEDGYQFMKKVRTLSAAEGGALPAIALTAFSRSTDRIRALSAGFQSHLVKPIEPAELALVIGSLTGRSANG